MHHRLLLASAIGAVLLFGYALNESRTAISRGKDQYVALTRSCHEAQANADAVAELARSIAPRAAGLLERSASIFLMVCYAQQRQRLVLEQLGVSDVTLRGLDLDGLAAADTPSVSFVAAVLKGTFERSPAPQTLAVRRAPVSDDELYEVYLRRVVLDLGLRALPTKEFVETDKFRLGQALFFDPILSGERDVACATCHLVERGTSDGLRRSIGAGGVGIAELRELPSGRPRQPRNALDLWNRDNNRVHTMLWDGAVEVIDTPQQRFRTPVGTMLPPGFENLMAVQSVFPLTRTDEMLGLSGHGSAGTLPNGHANKENEIAVAGAGVPEAERILSVFEAVMERLLGGVGSAEPWKQTYRQLFIRAYPGEQTFGIAHVGNALAHFIELAFPTRETPWDIYLGGASTAISLDAKRGAFVFFGKGRCVVCHEGPLFSDFGFHSVGVPNRDPASSDEEDFGRYVVTGNPSDKFLFRTPPLRNATISSPYFHNGYARSLEDAILQHLDPLRYADRYSTSGGHLMSAEQIAAVSPLLFPPVHLAPRELLDLIAFIQALTDQNALAVSQVVPAAVPSGLPIPRATSGGTRIE